MNVFKTVSKFDFLGIRKPLSIMSMLLIALCFWSFIVRGFVFGLDFTGGILMEVGYTEAVEDLGSVRHALEKAGFPDAFVQRFDTPKDVLIRLGATRTENATVLSNRAFAALKQSAAGKVELRRVEYVGPQVGAELIENGGLAVLYSLIGILIYVAIRFEYRFAVGAVVATIHDVIITVGVFSFFQLEFDLTVLAAVLAVIGYSLNDTVVVFDRIRENFRRIRKGSVIEIINLSLNETLSRTIITSGGTMMAVGSLYVYGGKILHGFAITMMVGIIVGTYSSIYVASATLVALGLSRTDMVVTKREVLVDEMP